MPTKSEPQLSVRDSCKRSGYSEATIRRYIASNRLPAVKIGGRLFVTVQDLDKAIAPAPVIATDDRLRAWAEHMATTAPPMRPEQRSMVISAFTSALGGSL